MSNVTFAQIFQSLFNVISEYDKQLILLQQNVAVAIRQSSISAASLPASFSSFISLWTSIGVFQNPSLLPIGILNGNALIVSQSLTDAQTNLNYLRQRLTTILGYYDQMRTAIVIGYSSATDALARWQLVAGSTTSWINLSSWLTDVVQKANLIPQLAAGALKQDEKESYLQRKIIGVRDAVTKMSPEIAVIPSSGYVQRTVYPLENRSPRDVAFSFANQPWLGGAPLLFTGNLPVNNGEFDAFANQIVIKKNSAPLAGTSTVFDYTELYDCETVNISMVVTMGAVVPNFATGQFVLRRGGNVFSQTNPVNIISGANFIFSGTMLLNDVLTFEVSSTIPLAVLSNTEVALAMSFTTQRCEVIQRVTSLSAYLPNSSAVSSVFVGDTWSSQWNKWSTSASGFITYLLSVWPQHILADAVEVWSILLDRSPTLANKYVTTFGFSDGIIAVTSPFLWFTYDANRKGGYNYFHKEILNDLNTLLMESECTTMLDNYRYIEE